MHKIIVDLGEPFILVENNSAFARISLFGGQVMSYRPRAERHDLLFCSDKAVFDGQSAIRGGIPVCWPWFGMPPAGVDGPNHGFARNNRWELESINEITASDTLVKLRLVYRGYMETIWPHRAELSLQITIGARLIMDLMTTNTGLQSFEFTQALHAYFQVGDISQVVLRGLEGADYLDKLDKYSKKQQHGPVLVEAELDRIYGFKERPLKVVDHFWQREIVIMEQGGHSIIVWNPWAEKSANIKDLGRTDYRRFLCVEVGNALNEAVSLAPGDSHHLRADIDIKAIELEQQGNESLEKAM